MLVSRIQQIARVILVMAAVQLVAGCADEAKRPAPEPEKSWTLGSQARHSSAVRDSALDDLSPRAIAEAKRRGMFTDTAEEIAGILQVRTGPFFPRATEIDRQGLAIALIHEMRRPAGIVVYVDGRTGEVIAAYNEEGRVRDRN